MGNDAKGGVSSATVRGFLNRLTVPLNHCAEIARAGCNVRNMMTRTLDQLFDGFPRHVVMIGSRLGQTNQLASCRVSAFFLADCI
jgi:hypothetical protein